MKLDYIQRLQLGIMDADKRFPSTGVMVVSVAHDEDCEIQTTGDCSCVPDIKFTQDKTPYFIDEEGVVHPEMLQN